MKYMLPAVVALGFGATMLPMSARADETVQPSRPAYGCVDPRATTALAIPDGRLRNRNWVSYVHRTGQCSLLPVGRPLTVLAHQGVLLLVKAPDAPDTALPLFVQSADMSAASTPAPAGPPEPPAPDASAPSPTPAPVPPAPPASSPPASSPPVSSPPAVAPDASQAATSAEAPGARQAATADAAAPAAPPAVPPAATEPPAAMPSPPSQDAGAAAPGSVSPAVAPTAAPPAASGVSATPPATPPNAAETPPPSTSAVPPASVPEVRHGSSGIVWLLLILGLALLALVGAAVLISRQQRRFAHVEGKDWDRDDGRDPLSSPAPVAPAVHPDPSPQSFRKACVAVLERGGWTIQPSFAAGTVREGAPDIVGRRHDAVLAVRCRGGSATVTPEIIDEVAAMGQAAHAHVTVLATPAPLTRRAHDEAMRLHVHVLDQDELASLSA